MWNIQEQEELDFQPSTEAEWDLYEAELWGSEHPEEPWVCSGRDVWYRNPYYTGPFVPHPEDRE